MPGQVTAFVAIFHPLWIQRCDGYAAYRAFANSYCKPIAGRENQLLRQKVDLLVRRVFGSNSEKLDSAQLQLLQLPEAAVTPEPQPAPSVTPVRVARPRPPKPPRLPDNLPVVERMFPTRSQ